MKRAINWKNLATLAILASLVGGGSALAADSSTVTGTVTDVGASEISVRKGSRLMRFETEAPAKGLRPGDRVEVRYVLEAKSVKRRKQSQEAGEAAPKQKIIIDDRAFFPA